MNGTRSGIHRTPRPHVGTGAAEVAPMKSCAQSPAHGQLEDPLPVTFVNWCGHAQEVAPTPTPDRCGVIPYQGKAR
jgi:hypothetical protein